MATITDANMFVDSIQDVEAFVQLLDIHFYKDFYGRLDCKPLLECDLCPIYSFCTSTPHLLFDDVIKVIEKRHIELFL